EGLQQASNNYQDLAADGWSKNGSLYTRTRSFPDGSTCAITVDDTAHNAPTVRAQATVVSPTFVQRRATSFFAAVGTTVTSDTNSPSVARAVLVHTSRGSLFKKALAARNTINLNGNNIVSDSFDSADPSKSRYGVYDTSVYSGDKGDIACNGAVINIGNANIYGHAATGPNGSLGFNSNGHVGEHSWVNSHPGQNIEPGWVTDDSNFTVPSTDFPYNASTSGVGTVDPTGGDVVTSTNQITSTSYTNSTTYPNPVPPGG